MHISNALSETYLGLNKVLGYFGNAFCFVLPSCFIFLLSNNLRFGCSKFTPVLDESFSVSVIIWFAFRSY